MATLKNGDKSVDFADNKCKIVNLKLAEISRLAFA